jgi:hypothetical protein
MRCQNAVGLIIAVSRKVTRPGDDEVIPIRRDTRVGCPVQYHGSAYTNKSRGEVDAAVRVREQIRQV